MKKYFIIPWIFIGLSTAYAQNVPPLTLPSPPAAPNAGALTLQPPPPDPSSQNQRSAIPLSPGLEAYRAPADTTNSAPEASPTSAQTSANPKLSPVPVAAPTGAGTIPTNLQENVSNTVAGQIYDVAPPPLTLPGAPDAPVNNFGAGSSQSPPPPPAPGTLDALAIPSDATSKIEMKDDKIPSWKQPLKPSVKPIETRHDFRRATLPSTIYRDSYDPANRQLPTAQTNALYDHYFLLAVARDDLNGIRAMLANGYRDVNLFNAEGDTALIVAIRHNAIAAARLLIARGADPYLTGRGGFSAYDYARQLDNPELNAALEGIFG